MVKYTGWMGEGGNRMEEKGRNISNISLIIISVLYTRSILATVGRFMTQRILLYVYPKN